MYYNTIEPFVNVFNDLLCIIDNNAIKQCQNTQKKCKSSNMRFEVIESDNEYKIIADVPGCDINNIKIHSKDDLLIIEANNQALKLGENEKILYGERFTGTLKTCIPIDKSFDMELTSAKLKNGVLKITIPKKEESKPKNIKITVDK